MSEIPREPASVSPSASDNRFAIEQFLRSRGAAAMAHPGGTLLEHLLRVGRKLAEWGAPPDVQVAGLCHAAYGTDGFAPFLVDPENRSVLMELVGKRAESLVYLYASCDRAATYPRLRGGERPVFRDRFTGVEQEPDADGLRAFLEITAANELDVFAHNEELASRYRPGLYRLLEPTRAMLSAAAWDAVERELGGAITAP